MQNLAVNLAQEGCESPFCVSSCCSLRFFLLKTANEAALLGVISGVGRTALPPTTTCQSLPYSQSDTTELNQIANGHQLPANDSGCVTWSWAIMAQTWA
jgi:hypothetical protein